jgi:putative oxidoreductase
MSRIERSGWDTAREFGFVALRVALGAIFFAHGAQKLLGWFGGPGFSATVQFFGAQMGVPAPLAVLAILTEFFGGLAVLFGVFTRFAGLGLAVTMIVAAVKVHLANGFFMNWTGTPGVGHGIEMNLALGAMALFLTLAGPGQVALAGDTERWLLERLTRRDETKTQRATRATA